MKNKLASTFTKELNTFERNEDKMEYFVKNVIESNRLKMKCQNCWLLHENCACKLWRNAQTKTTVVIHLHHAEW